MKRKIHGARAIVTGASSGIGREVARELARQGAKVVMIARRQERLEELAAPDRRRRAAGRSASPATSPTRPSARRRSRPRRASFGGLDILVNNAGVGALGLFDGADPQRVRHVMEVNFFALVEMTRLALPLLKQGNRPIVVNVSSILGHRGVPYNSEYAASKFAVCGFSESVRAEWAAAGIDVLVVSPGTTDTEFFDKVIARTRGARLARARRRDRRLGGPASGPGDPPRPARDHSLSLGQAALLAQSPLAPAGRWADGEVCLGARGQGKVSRRRERPDGRRKEV